MCMTYTYEREYSDYLDKEKIGVRLEKAKRKGHRRQEKQVLKDLTDSGGDLDRLKEEELDILYSTV